MAKLKSIIKIEGTLDDLTLYKGKEGYLVKTKGGLLTDFTLNTTTGEIEIVDFVPTLY